MSESSSVDYLRGHMDGHDEGYSRGFVKGLDAAREMISEELESHAERCLEGVQRVESKQRHYHDALMQAAHKIREQKNIPTAIEVYKELFEETEAPGAA